MRHRLLAALAASVILILPACSAPADSPGSPAATLTPEPMAPPAAQRAAEDVPSSTAEPESSALPTVASTSLPATAVAAASPTVSTATETQRLILTLEQSEARYRVREQLANRSLPSDAVGVTTAVSGQIVLETDGTVIPAESRFVVDLSTLRSDSDRRDNYIHRNTLETARFPTAEFVPTEVRGLPNPLPTSGDVTFQLIGDLTLHGVTRPVTWDVTARIERQTLAGSATTQVRFDDFNMMQPRVPILLSVEDTVQIELDFHLIQQS